MDRFPRSERSEHDEFSTFNPNDLIVRVITNDGAAREFTATPEVAEDLKSKFRSTVTRNPRTGWLTKVNYADGGISLMGDDEVTGVKVIQPNGKVIDALPIVAEAEAPKASLAPVLFEIDNRIVVTYDQGARRSHVERVRSSFNLHDVVAIRVRPLGRGDHMENRRFVEIRFSGGGFIRAIASLEEANTFDTIAYDLFAGNGVNSASLTWNAGTYEILLRADTIAGYEIDQHEQRQDSRPPRQPYRAPREDRGGGYGPPRGGYQGGGYQGGGPRREQSRDYRQPQQDYQGSGYRGNGGGGYRGNGGGGGGGYRGNDNGYRGGDRQDHRPVSRFR